jgi:hypothetical protein
LHSVELNSLGWVTYDGYINLWTLTFTLNLSQALELLAYLGYNVEHENQLSAITVSFCSIYHRKFIFQLNIVDYPR